jgi:hypothetical protein
VTLRATVHRPFGALASAFSPMTRRANDLETSAHVSPLTAR